VPPHPFMRRRYWIDMPAKRAVAATAAPHPFIDRAEPSLDGARFVKRFDFPVEEARRLALEFVGAEGVQPFLKNPVLKDRVIRTIERYHVALSQTPDEGVINAPVHLIRCDKSVDEFHDADGSLVCSKSAWAGATRGPLRTYQGSGDHGHMLHSPHLAANAALLAEIFAAIFPDDSSEGADQ